MALHQLNSLRPHSLGNMTVRVTHTYFRADQVFCYVPFSNRRLSKFEKSSMLARTVHINLAASLCPPSSTIINNRSDNARQVESVTFHVRVDLTLALSSRYINTSGNPTANNWPTYQLKIRPKCLIKADVTAHKKAGVKNQNPSIIKINLRRLE